MAGFPPQTIEFLRDLRANNHKDWFHANRDRYEAHYLAPARAFVDAAGAAIRDFAPDIHAEPTVGGSLFRVNRDIRFTSSTEPYKPYLDLWFWEGDRGSAPSGFYLRLTPETVAIGVGAYQFHPDRLARYRRAVTDPEAGADLQAALDDLRGAGFEIPQPDLKRVPKGFDPDTPHADLLRHKRLFVAGESDHPGVLGSTRFVTWCARRWARQLPLHRWLVTHTG